jgi:hypothetical protein
MFITISLLIARTYKQPTPQGLFGLCCWRRHTVEQTPIEQSVPQNSIDCITRSNISQTITPSSVAWLQLICAKTWGFHILSLQVICLLYCGAVLSFGCITMFRTNFLLPSVGSELLAYEFCRLCRHVSCKFQGNLQGDVSQQVCLLLIHERTWSHKPQNTNLKNISVIYAWSFIRYQLSAWVSRIKYQRKQVFFFHFLEIFSSVSAPSLHCRYTRLQ